MVGFIDVAPHNHANEIFVPINKGQPVPVAERSKAYVYGCAPAEIVGSNPTRRHGRLSVVSVVCCVLSCRGLCDELITRPKESYRLWRVFVCDLEASKEEAKAH